MTAASVSLERLTAAERMLAEIVTAQDALYAMNIAEAARVYAEQMRLGTSASNHATAIKVKAELKLAEIVDHGQANGTIATHGGDRQSNVRPPDVESIGVSRQKVYEARKLRTALPDATAVDAVVDEANEKGEAVSRQQLLKMATHYSSATGEWSTPDDLFLALDAEFHFETDVCATTDNAKCPVFYTEEEDGLAQPWTGTCWMNPPYGDVIPRWVEKARLTAETGEGRVVALVPARVDTGWWWRNCIRYEIRFLRGRLKFGGGDTSAPFPSAVIVFDKPVERTVWWEWR